MMNVKEVLDRHDKAVLFFSGGKDSMACLHMLEPYLDKIIVLWANTGAAFPELLSLMNGIKNRVPHFLEVKSDQPANIAAMGYPAEVVPANYTVVGQVISGRKTVKIQSYIDCCNRNIWSPSFTAALNTGAKLFIRGQRADDVMSGPFKNGEVRDGIEYLYPLETWSRVDVLAYLKERGFKAPAHYALEATSLDCWSCTAYCYEHKDKLAYMKQHHPDWHDEYRERLFDVRRAIAQETRTLDRLLEE